MQVRSVSCNEEICKYATTYALKCRYGAYQVMKKYASMQLRMCLNAGMEHTRSWRSMQVCNCIYTEMQVRSISGHEEVCKYATAYVLKCRYGAYHVMKQVCNYATMYSMYLNAGTEHIRWWRRNSPRTSRPSKQTSDNGWGNSKRYSKSCAKPNHLKMLFSPVCAVDS